MRVLRLPHGRRSKPLSNALCKAVQGIIVAKPPQPKPALPVNVAPVNKGGTSVWTPPASNEWTNQL
jgi:hypothetical protein